MSTKRHEGIGTLIIAAVAQASVNRGGEKNGQAGLSLHCDSWTSQLTAQETARLGTAAPGQKPSFPKKLGF